MYFVNSYSVDVGLKLVKRLNERSVLDVPNLEIALAVSTKQKLVLYE